MNRKFGRVPSPLDIRDYNLKSFIPGKLSLEGSKCWPFLSEPLDQGDTPHCVGFSMADWGNNLPVEDSFTNDDGHSFYYLCKILDGEAGQENGSCLRSAAKALQEMGKLDNYAFASSVDEITYWILNKGPVIVGTWWTSGMMKPDENNILHPFGEALGGHAYLINEKTSDGYYGIQNSWGNWGSGGKAYILITDFEAIFHNGGEAIASVELSTTLNKNTGCLLMLKKLISDIMQKRS